jgi:hypothetical protein
MEVPRTIHEDPDRKADTGFLARTVTSRRSANEDKHRERSIDKSALESHLTSLLSSVENAIGKLQNQMATNTSPALAARMQEYQGIALTAQGVLAALRMKGESISSLSRVEASISSDFALDEVKKDAVVAEDKLPVASQAIAATAETILLSQPLMRTLTSRGEEENTILSENAELRAQAANQVATGKKDFDSTVNVASMLYDAHKHPETAAATQEKIAQFMEQKKEEMHADGVSDADIQARSARILEKAQYIHAGMLQSQETGSRRLLETAEEFVANPVRAQMDLSEAHMDKGTAHMEERLRKKLGHHPQEHMDEYKRQVANWKILKEGTIQQLDAQVESAKQNASGIAVADSSGSELYSGIANRLKLDDMMSNLSNYADANATMLGGQADLFSYIHGKTQTHQKEVADLFTGKTTNAEVAESLGMKKRDLKLAATQFRVESGQSADDGLFASLKRDLMLTLNPGKGLSAS